MVDRLTAGGRVADVGCGHGASTILMAQAFPRSAFVGTDYHEPSIETARQRATRRRLDPDRVAFTVAEAHHWPAGRFDLITFFDCLHDMGDPVGAAAVARAALAPDGALMVVEPMAGDRLDDNLNPVGRVFYGASTMVCTPARWPSPDRPRSVRRPARATHRRPAPGRVQPSPDRDKHPVQPDPRRPSLSVDHTKRRIPMTTTIRVPLSVAIETRDATPFSPGTHPARC